MTGAIYGQSNGEPLKATQGSHLRILGELPDNSRKPNTLLGLMNNILGLDPLCDVGYTVTLDKYDSYGKY